jgi:hypothetical protein
MGTGAEENCICALTIKILPEELTHSITISKTQRKVLWHEYQKHSTSQVGDDRGSQILPRIPVVA